MYAMNVSLLTETVLKFRNNLKQPRQTAQTQIRLLLKKHSQEAVWSGSSLFAIMKYSPEHQHFILEKKEKSVRNYGHST